MGRVSLHGEPVVDVFHPTEVSWVNPTGVGGAHQSTTSDHVLGFPNRVKGSARNILTCVVWQRHVSSPGTYRSPLHTRGSGLTNPVGMLFGGTWLSNWDDIAATWGYGSGPAYSTSSQLLATVFNSTTIEWWIDGVLAPTTQTGLTLTALNFDNCTQWQTADNVGPGQRSWPNPISLYALYDRALTGNDFAALYADPFCFMRR